jgi:hypothetical protein
MKTTDHRDREIVFPDSGHDSPHGVDAQSLYLLALLLTGNHENAKKCVVTGIDAGQLGGDAFREWAHAWARRVIVRNAVRFINPRVGTAAGRPTSQTPGRVIEHGDRSLRLARVLELADFDRFVFVLTIFEGYRLRDSSILLECPAQAILESLAKTTEGDTITRHHSGSFYGFLKSLRRLLTEIKNLLVRDGASCVANDSVAILEFTS